MLVSVTKDNLPPGLDVATSCSSKPTGLQPRYSELYYGAKLTMLGSWYELTLKTKLYMFLKQLGDRVSDCWSGIYFEIGSAIKSTIRLFSIAKSTCAGLKTHTIPSTISPWKPRATIMSSPYQNWPRRSHTSTQTRESTSAARAHFSAASWWPNCAKSLA